MPDRDRHSTAAGSASALRLELCARARHYAGKNRLPYVDSYGAQPVVVFPPYRKLSSAAGPEAEPCADGPLHGNFLPASYKAILAREDWRRRLGKVHTQARSSVPSGDRGRWRELDSCTSSDALLMNVFCCPGVLRERSVCGLLGAAAGVCPEFGVAARVPLASGRFDRTEIDMRLGGLLVEAKLTESDFQSAATATVESYRDFAACFIPRDLERRRGCYCSYQLIRNVLAAHATGASFCVLADARRPDLIEAWYRTLRCVRPVDLRVRCQVLTWQELASALPLRLRRFLDEKYGIAA